MSRSTPNTATPKPSGDDTAGDPPRRSAPRTYFDLLEEKYADDPEPTPAFQDPPAEPARRGHPPIVEPVPAPKRRRFRKRWILPAAAIVALLTLWIAVWSRPSIPEASDPPEPETTISGPETTGSAAPRSQEPVADGEPAVDPEPVAPAASEAATGPEPEPFAVSFPELSTQPSGSGGPGPIIEEEGIGEGIEVETVAPAAPPFPDPPADPAASPRSTDAETIADETTAAEEPDAEADEEPVSAAGRAFTPPEKIFAPQPAYPEAARNSGEKGTVIVEATITADGDVRDARVARSISPALDRAALETFRTWQFEPARRDGEPVASPYRLAFRFALDDPEPPTAAREPTRTDEPLPWQGDFEPPTRYVTPLPSYPQSAWATGTQGNVVLEVVVDREGRVTDVEVIEGLPHGINAAAVDAVRRWRFRPATRDGEPVAVYHRLTLRFAP